jgi:aspartate/methionine/tyrosine aminotransferase
VLPEPLLKDIVALAQKHGILLFSDEVFRPLFHGSVEAPPLISLGYANTVSTGSVSKAQGLAGIRVGWIVSPKLDLIERVMTVRDYTTLSVSQLDEGVASFALSPAVLPRLMQRNLAACQRSIDLLEAFVQKNSKRCHWLRPAGAGTAFIQILDHTGQPVDDADFVRGFGKKYAISIIPGGHCFSDDEEDDFKGYIRLSLGDDDKLEIALPLLQKYLDEA